MATYLASLFFNELFSFRVATTLVEKGIVVLGAPLIYSPFVAVDSVVAVSLLIGAVVLVARGLNFVKKDAVGIVVYLNIVAAQKLFRYSYGISFVLFNLSWILKDKVLEIVNFK